MSALKRELRSLGAFITNKPPYCSGTLAVPNEDLILFYGKDGVASRIDLSHASEEDLKHLAEACDVATFGIAQRDVLDESYRKAGKLDTSAFSMQFHAGDAGLLEAVKTDLMEAQRQRPIRAELYKLNVYGPKSFFKSHVDTPRSETMFGSLVVVFRTPHKGGALALRHDNQEWTFDSAATFAEQSEPCVAYVAFYSDVEHEVLPVETGYRVTLTYNLYFGSEDPYHTVPNIHPNPLTESPFRDRLKELLKNPAFLPLGGTLGFGLRHQYPLKTKGAWRYERKGVHPLKDLLVYLKGSDAVLLRICREFHLNASVQLLFRDTNGKRDVEVLCDRVVDMSDDCLDTQLWFHLRENYGGKLLRAVDGPEQQQDIEVHWVTETPKVNSIESPYIAYGNGASAAHTYMYLCLIIEVGKAGNRETAE
ncbi:hypothetical protein BKA93DRAFT_735463 [Sparassis latifolia]|uniref:Fe2OG dioxygenase domain-containing protein n=1 Tax=Sparassis crispa TaxID=139825 RepID=A0A401GSW7_9APHY|nr:hypothetical protein SCP_0705280 [Sparassis crispa]GBE85341.1 hypothetical protein SCP_0705280 [Sparassis crispa]